MRKTIKLTMLAMALLLAATTMHAQDTAKPEVKNQKAAEQEPAKFFHLNFVVKELEGGKVVNSRSYAMIIGVYPYKQFGPGAYLNQQARSIRTGTRVPVEMEAGKSDYVDVGVNIDCRSTMLVQNQLAMNVSAEVSSIETAPDGAAKTSLPPIHQNKLNSDVIVSMGKPTVLFTSDDVTSRRTLELELTATPIR